MKKMLVFSFLASLFCVYGYAVEVTVSGAKNVRMPLTIVVLDSLSQDLIDVAGTIKKDLQFTDQFNVKIEPIPVETTKKSLFNDIKKMCLAGIPLVVCLSVSDEKSIEWRMYDTMQGTLLSGKKYKKQGKIVRGWAHAIADEIFTALTGNAGFFSSRIAYCKEVVVKEGKKVRNIYIADFDGTNQELLVDDLGIKVAPRWNVDQKNPGVFYSEYTDMNVRLMFVDMKKKSKVASNLDGVNMLASCSPDGKAVIYSASKGNGNCQLYYHTKDAVRQFTCNNGNNVPAVFIDNNQVCFCSDAQTGSPQIYIGNLQTGHVKRITRGGYCTSPSYCPVNNCISYHQKINNIMQIILYDCGAKTHKQITKGSENNHESSWSPCGNYLVYAQEKSGKSRLVSFNVIANTTKFLTSATDYCSYPHWSPSYKQFPVVV